MLLRRSYSVRRAFDLTCLALRGKTSIVPLVLCALVSFLLALWVWFPGVFIYDAWGVLSQAKGLSPLNNSHPPILALFWRLELYCFGWIVGNHFSIWVTSLGLGTVSLFYLLAPLKSERWQQVLLFVFVFFCPLFFSILGSLYKDVFLIWLLIFMAGMLGRRYLCIDYKNNKVLTLLFVILAALSTLLRYNALFIVSPLLVCWFLKEGWKCSLKTLSYSVILLPLLYGFIIGFNTLVHTEKGFAQQSLEIFDLAGIDRFRYTHLGHWNKGTFSPDVDFPDNWNELSHDQKAAICYSRWGWDDLSQWASNKMCSSVGDEWRSLNRKELQALWRSSILKYPLSYLRHRIAHFTYLMGFSNQGRTNLMDEQGDFPPGYYDKLSDRRIRDVYANQIARDIKNYFFYTPFSYGFVWLAILLMTFLATLQCKNKRTCIVNGLSFAGLMYMLGYFFVGVASEWRYLLPSEVLELIIFVIYFFYPQKNLDSKVFKK